MRVNSLTNHVERDSGVSDVIGDIRRRGIGIAEGELRCHQIATYHGDDEEHLFDDGNILSELS